MRVRPSPSLPPSLPPLPAKGKKDVGVVSIHWARDVDHLIGHHTAPLTARGEIGANALDRRWRAHPHDWPPAYPVAFGARGGKEEGGGRRRAWLRALLKRTWTYVRATMAQATRDAETSGIRCVCPACRPRGGRLPRLDSWVYHGLRRFVRRIGQSTARASPLRVLRDSNTPPAPSRVAAYRQRPCCSTEVLSAYRPAAGLMELCLVVCHRASRRNVPRHRGPGFLAVPGLVGRVGVPLPSLRTGHGVAPSCQRRLVAASR